MTRVMEWQGHKRGGNGMCTKFWQYAFNTLNNQILVRSWKPGIDAVRVVCLPSEELSSPHMKTLIGDISTCFISNISGMLRSQWQ